MTVSQHLPILGASACVFKDGRVLMIQRAKPPAGIWALPGGHVELGETAIEAAHRELLEETGVRAGLSHFVGLYDIIQRAEDGAVLRHFVVACYGGLWLSGDARAAGDAAAARWMRREEHSQMALQPSVTDAIGRMERLLKL